MRRFELVEGSASKFWEIEQAENNALNIRWGRIGTEGQSQTKSFADAAKAQAACDKLIKEKTGKGYAEVGVVAGAGMGRTEALPQPATQVPTVAQAASPAVAVPSLAPAVPMARSVVADPAAKDVPPWLAHGEPLFLDDARLLAYASRRHPKALTLPDPAANWKQVREQASLCSPLANPNSNEALRPALQRMVDRLSLKAPPPDADAEADALLLAMLLNVRAYEGDKRPNHSIIDQLVMAYGLVGAVDVFLAAQRIGVQRLHYQDLGSRLHLTTPTSHPMCDNYSSGPIRKEEERLRSHLAAAPLAQWQTCAERIEAALPGLHPSRQPVVALLLPELPALSNALALSLTALEDPPLSAHWLMLVATDPAAVSAAANVLPKYRRGFWSHRQMVMTALLERGTQAMQLLEPGADNQEAGEALACIGTPEAISILAKVASVSTSTKARLLLAVDRWPEAALVALTQLVAQGGKDVALLTSSLSRLLRTHTMLGNRLRPWLDPAAQGVLDRQLSLLSVPAEVATMKELPVVLAEPPWQAAVSRKAPATLVLQPLTLAPVEQWDSNARKNALQMERWHRKKYSQAQTNLGDLLDLLGFETHCYEEGAVKVRWRAAMTTAREVVSDAIRREDTQTLIKTWVQMRELRRELHFAFMFSGTAVTLLPPHLGLALWNSLDVGPAMQTDGVEFAMATLGLQALPGLLAVMKESPNQHLALALNFGAVELAMPVARAFVKLKTKSLRDSARQWLLDFPEHAACGLIAPALGKSGAARDCAGSALRLLKIQGHEALLLEVAGRYGDPAVLDGLQSVLGESPLDRFPAKRSPLPEWWRPHGWRRPLLLNGKALPDEALDPIGQMLSFPTTEEVYGGIAVVQQDCQPGSLADFAWDAFTAWLEAGGPSKEGWGLTALGLLGNDDTARRLTPFIRAWPGESLNARAVVGLDVLAAIGTDVALMLLNGIAQKIKFKGLQDKAQEKIDAIAEARGLSTEELEDRLAPDLGLDERGTLVLDFGPRAFTVTFDESLKPYVREAGEGGAPGARLPDLPKPKKTDDEAKAKEAVERFKLLKKDARTIASQQLLRLEVAMCARRRWTPELFRMFLVEHPLVRYIVQRLIWGVYKVADGASDGGTLVSCFRVAEDGSFANAQDDTFQLPEGQNLRIGVPHALEIPAADVAAFGQVFADYELLQPFAQIGRDTYTLTEDEKKELKLLRWNGTKVPTGKVLGLVNKGWRRGQTQDGGGIWYFTKPLGANQVIELRLDPGLVVGIVDHFPEQTLGEVQVGQPSSSGDLQHPEPFATLDAIKASELIRDLEALRS
jgi:predicted DNA-binding WGR domain protein